MSKIVLTPKISEKAINLAETGVYIFEVPTSANKIMVKEAVESAFKVRVTDVNMIVQKGKLKTFKRVPGRQKDVKKALVKVQKGQKIALFEVAK